MTPSPYPLPRGARVNKKGRLTIGGCDAVGLARRFGTPLYVFDEEQLKANCAAYRESFQIFYPNETRIAYAAKSFLTKAMAGLVLDEGLFLDAASAGELYTATSAGFPCSKIYLHGNCKTQEEIETALRRGVHRIIVDNEQELESINSIAKRLGKTARILIRLTPGVEAHTHDYTKTGQLETKFGIHIAGSLAMTAARKTLNMKNIELRGFHCHIGSQIFELKPYKTAISILFEFLEKLRSKTGRVFNELDLGGGLGIRYLDEDKPPEIREYAKVISQTVVQCAKKFSYPLPRLIVEPGRSISGGAGTTLYTIRYIKTIPGEINYVIVDGGFSDNPRPALYGAKYKVVVADRAGLPANFRCTVSGKHCEADTLFKDVKIARPRQGDILAVFATGAYNYSMASNYNRYPRPAVIMADKGKVRLIVRRETLKDLIRQDAG